MTPGQLHSLPHTVLALALLLPPDQSCWSTGCWVLLLQLRAQLTGRGLWLLSGAVLLQEVLEQMAPADHHHHPESAANLQSQVPARPAALLLLDPPPRSGCAGGG
jgi:hypothetical protein